MRRGCRISINQLADFYKGSDAKKRRIIFQQKEPNPFLIQWYQLAKSRIRKSLKLKGDLEPVLSGLEELKNRKPIKKRQISDRDVSIEALQRFIEMRLPSIFLDTEYEVIKPLKNKSFMLNGVDIIVSPDVIIRGEVNGRTFFGGIKLHISKSNKFDVKQQTIVVGSIFKYLEEECVNNENEYVIPELCLSIDLFGDGIVSADDDVYKVVKNIYNVCNEVKRYWAA